MMRHHFGSRSVSAARLVAQNTCQALQTKLDPRIDPIGNVTGLKDRLAGLRNVSVVT